MALLPQLVLGHRPTSTAAQTRRCPRRLAVLPVLVLLGLVALVSVQRDMVPQRFRDGVSVADLASYLHPKVSETSETSDDDQDPLAPIDASPERDHDQAFSFDAAAATHASWMQAVPDTRSLAHMSLPGTHDTMTHRVGLLGFRCQNAALHDQLHAGIRYLDIRARVQIVPGDDLHSTAPRPLGIYHAHVYTGYDLADVVATVAAFLVANPSETVVLRLKEEGAPIRGSVHGPAGPHPDDGTVPDVPSKSGSAFVDAFQHYLAAAPTATLFQQHLYGYAAGGAAGALNVTHIPTLGDLRGSFLLLQEFPYFPAAQSFRSAANRASTPWYGIPWALASPLLAVEDLWVMRDLATLDEKYAAIRANLAAAAHQARRYRASPNASASAETQTQKLFLSHLSASVGVTPIDAASGPRNRSVAGMNPRTGALLASSTLGTEPVGIVMADFPGAQLVDALVARNAFD